MIYCTLLLVVLDSRVHGDAIEVANCDEIYTFLLADQVLPLPYYDFWEQHDSCC